MPSWAVGMKPSPSSRTPGAGPSVGVPLVPTMVTPPGICARCASQSALSLAMSGEPTASSRAASSTFFTGLPTTAPMLPTYVPCDAGPMSTAWWMAGPFEASR